MAFTIPLRFKNFYVTGQSTVVQMPASWGEFAGAAATVGRDVPWTTAGVAPSQLFYERVWRQYLLRASLHQTATVLERSAAYESLDPSEKGATSFFIGQALAKFVAEKVFGCIVFAHLDTALKAIGLPVSGTRPDFIGLCENGRVLIVEAKGRSGNQDASGLSDAKAQVNALPSIPGYASTRYGSMSYFTASRRLRVVMQDPDGDDGGDVELQPVLEAHYGRLRMLIEGNDAFLTLIDGEPYRTLSLGDSGLTLGLAEEAIRDLDDLRAGRLDGEGFLARRIAAHRRRGGETPRQRVGSLDDDDGSALFTAPPSPSGRRRRRQLLRTYAQESEAAASSGVLLRADGTVTMVDDRWSEEQMMRQPDQREA